MSVSLRTFRLTVAAGTLAAAAAPMLMIGAGSSASASPLCEAVTTSGSVVGLHHFEKCVSYPFTPSCGDEQVDVGTAAVVVIDYCVP
jgi:hypothetical protein